MVTKKPNRWRWQGREVLRPITRLPTESGGDFQVGDAEKGAFRLVGQAFNLPAVREHNLLHDGQAQAGPLLVGGEVGLENFLTMFGRHAGAVIADFERRFGGTQRAASKFESVHSRRPPGWR